MDNSLRSIINKNNLKCKRITIKNNTRIIDTLKGRFVIKKKENNNINKIYNYLKSRAFDYFPEKLDENDEYELYKFIEDCNEPDEQKASDIIHLLTLLHSKTTFYKEVDYDYYKEIYENMNNQINYLYSYYNDLITIIDRSIYMSPSNYLIARNISTIFQTLNFCRETTEKWYNQIKNKKKIRVVNIHNNVKIEHFIKNDKPYLIGWTHTKKDNPIYDLLNFYKNHYLDFDFSELFYQYEKGYPLLEDERMLLSVLIAIPDKLELNDKEYNLCLKCTKFFDYLYKSHNLLSTYKKTKH